MTLLLCDAFIYPHGVLHTAYLFGTLAYWSIRPVSYRRHCTKTYTDSWPSSVLVRMSKKKGLSFEEKRDRMLEVFYSHKDVYQLKDLEKICPKVGRDTVEFGWTKASENMDGWMDRKYSPCRRVYVLFVLQEKGIISQSVKEVLTSLCDDGLVDTEKVGTSVYFWAFPSKALNLRFI